MDKDGTTQRQNSLPYYPYFLMYFIQSCYSNPLFENNFHWRMTRRCDIVETDYDSVNY